MVEFAAETLVWIEVHVDTRSDGAELKSGIDTLQSFIQWLVENRISPRRNPVSTAITWAGGFVPVDAERVKEFLHKRASRVVL